MLVASALVLSFTFSKTKYKGTGFISKIKIPVALADWRGEDLSKEFNINPQNDVYNFISDVLSYQYVNKNGENLIFIILDAGNFHDPRVCFISAGYEIKEMDDTELYIGGNVLRAHTLFTERRGGNFISFYWIIIDKNIAHEWIEQKLKQLYFSLFNKKRVGLMVRIDIPTEEYNIIDAKKIAEEFLSHLSLSLTKEDAAYIMGE